jgi:hypothetical protein
MTGDYVCSQSLFCTIYLYSSKMSRETNSKHRAESSSHGQYEGSLVLGGYDQSRLVENSSITIGMPQGTNKEQLRVLVSSMIINYANGSEPLSTAGSFQAVVESTLPYLYLPEDACEKFVRAFGLHTFDGDFYTLDSGEVARNKADIQSVEFVIQDPSNQRNSVTITLPYAAFNVNASWTWGYPTPQPIVPIRPMADFAVLGRTFLQEAYVFANYESDVMTFNVSQAAFPTPSAGSKIRSVYSSSYHNSHSHMLGGGAIAGIVIGVLFTIGALATIIWYFRFKKGPAPSNISPEISAEEAVSSQGAISELTSRPSHRKHMSELSSGSENDTHLRWNAIHEMEVKPNADRQDYNQTELADIHPLELALPQELEGEGTLGLRTEASEYSVSDRIETGEDTREERNV